MAQEDVARKVELAWLMDFYGGLLTDKQRQVLALHCEEDMSLSEIAQETGVSRQGVHEMLTRASEKLLGMEESLHAAGRFRRVREGLLRCRGAVADGRRDEALELLDELIRLEQEDGNGL